MSTFEITIDTDNAAFDEDPTIEVARILRSIAADITTYGEAAFDDGIIRLRDANGNRIGFAVLDATEGRP